MASGNTATESECSITGGLQGGLAAFLTGGLEEDIAFCSTTGTLPIDTIDTEQMVSEIGFAVGSEVILTGNESAAGASVIQELEGLYVLASTFLL